MVKTTSPLCSAEATGTLAKLITFYNARRQHAIRIRVRPRDPRSRDQRSRRAMFRFLTDQWSTLYPSYQAAWKPQATIRKCSNYNAYIAYNLESWHNFLSPGQYYPVTRTGGVGTLHTGPSAAWVEHVIELTIKVSPYALNWGVVYFARPQSGFSSAQTNAIIFQRLRTTATITTQWIPPDEGTWHFNARLFSVYGNLGAELGEFTPP